jgi:hypothetical protein
MPLHSTIRIGKVGATGLAASIRLLALSASIVVAGCKSTPTCEDAVQQASKKVSELADRSAMSEVVAVCVRNQWSGEFRSCVAGVRDEPDFMACMLRYANESETKNEAPDV